MATIETSTWATKVGLARMLSGGVIMDVVTADHARIAQEAGAVAVMALERVPSDIRKFGGVARMSDPKLIEEIKAAVSIPVMAKCRIGHIAEAQILQQLEVDFIDESEVLTPADEEHHIDKHEFRVPFVCGCRDLGEALRRIGEGAAMIRTKGEAGTGNIVEAVRHMRAVMKGIRELAGMREDELYAAAKELRAPLDVVRQTATLGELPVPNFSAGWRGHAGRRQPDAPARRAGGLRGERHLQEREPRARGPRDRDGHHPLGQRRDPGRGEHRPGRADARPGALRDPGGGTPGRSRLVGGAGLMAQPALAQ